ncbi:MAG: glycoside hydrolase family 127 protein [Clostridia bacterium]|nr:glycoside hydrolase family 127 protein [Clostridia bacterium]
MYNFFESNSIKPKGWLLKQLEIQANGLSGNLDKVWPDIRDSAWIGGEKEGWERVPYWLDGFIPLAFLLENEDMIGRAEKYINAILDRQQEDGWICPCKPEQRGRYDVWAHFLIGKVLAVYCDFTHSIRAQEALYSSMKCLYSLMKSGDIKLFEWGEYRWFECMIPLQFLYEIYREEWLKELGALVREQGADYTKLTELWKRPLNKWTLDTHIVNLCMMLKYEAVSCWLLGGDYTDAAESLWEVLESYNGTAVGTFTGDECLSGLNNNQGTELCSVVELMYTCELMYAITGKNIWADRLEKLAFNALPAAMSDDMWTHQYDQQVNQIACVKLPGRSIFRTNNGEAHLFGLEPHFGCCTANHNQGWPKLTLSSYIKSDKGITCAVMLPSVLETTLNGVKVTVSCETEYPFRNRGVYTVETNGEVSFELKIRIPKWAKEVTVDGDTFANSGYVTVNKNWNGRQTVTVELTAEPELVSRPYGMYAVEYGSLVFSLPVKYRKQMHEYEQGGVERKFPYCDYELYPETEWRFGFADTAFEVVEKQGDEIPFSSQKPRLALKARFAPIEWDFADGFETVADKAPLSEKALGAAEEKEMIPYGCAKLRITETVIIE